MSAVPLIFGRLTAADYEDDVANDPRIDRLRDKMEVRENEQFTKDYFDPDKRYIGNAVQVFFNPVARVRRNGWRGLAEELAEQDWRETEQEKAAGQGIAGTPKELEASASSDQDSHAFAILVVDPLEDVLPHRIYRNLS